MPSDVGPRLQRLLEQRRHGRSLSATIRDAGLSVQQVFDIMHGRKSPSVETMDRIVRALGSTLGELFADPEP